MTVEFASCNVYDHVMGQNITISDHEPYMLSMGVITRHHTAEYGTQTVL